MIELYQLVKPLMRKYAHKGVSSEVSYHDGWYREELNDTPRMIIYYHEIWIASISDDCAHFHVQTFATRKLWHVKLPAAKFDKIKFDNFMKLAISKVDDLLIKREEYRKAHYVV